jgi:hypothetical protein
LGITDEVWEEFEEIGSVAFNAFFDGGGEIDRVGLSVDHLFVVGFEVFLFGEEAEFGPDDLVICAGASFFCKVEGTEFVIEDFVAFHEVLIHVGEDWKGGGQGQNGNEEEERFH